MSTHNKKMNIREEIEKILDFHIKKYKINIKISYKMPNLLKEGFGSFDVCENTLFLNGELINKKNRVRMLFTMFHELRHAQQYLFPERFSKEIQNSINYVVQYDGNCYKLENKKWKSCKLEDLDFLNVYLGLPYELDANRYAFEKTLKIISKNEIAKLKEIYSKSKPLKNDFDYKEIFKTIDDKTKV